MSGRRGLDDFIGREVELARLQKHLASPDPPPFQIVGPPGVGKTCLLQEVLLRTESLSIWLLDPSEGELEALAHDPRLSRSSDTRAVLVLDDFRGAIPQIECIKDVVVLVTSTDCQATLAGEILHLSPLSPEEGQAFFALATKRVRPDFTVEENLPTIAAIVERVDALPSRLMVCAARMRTYSATQVLQSLEEEPLETPRRTREEVAALPLAAAKALANLTVFSGGFSHSAARAVLGPSLVGFETLTRLVNCSLLDVTYPSPRDEPWFRCLRVHAVAAVSRHGPPTARVTLRHAQFFANQACRWLKELEGTLTPDAWQAIRRNAENVRAAALVLAPKENALDAARCWLLTGAVSVQLAQYETAASDLFHLKGLLAETDSVEARELKVMCLLQTATLAMHRMVPGDAQALLAGAPVSISARLRCQIAASRAWCAWAVGDLVSSQSYLSEAREELVEAPNQLGRLLTLESLMEESLETALLRMEEAVFELEKSGHILELPQALRYRGVILLQSGRRDEARVELTEARHLAQDFGPLGVAAADLYLATASAADGQYKEATHLLRRAISECPPKTPVVVTCYAVLSACELACGDHSAALAALRTAQRSASFANPRQHGCLVVMEPILFFQQERLARAKATLSRARFEVGGYPGQLLEIFGHLVDLAEQFISGLSLRWSPDLTRALPEVHAIAAALCAASTSPLIHVLSIRGSQYSLGGTEIELGRRRAARQIMAGLSTSQEALGVDEIFELGWPGEVALPDSKAQRVYTAIWTLRKLGFDAVIHRTDGGYHLDPAIRVEHRHKPEIA